MIMGIPVRSQKRLLLDFPSTSTKSSVDEQGKRYRVIGKVNKLGEKVDCFAQGIREHVRIAPKLSETLKGKLSLGARILQVGGVEKVFKQIFINNNNGGADKEEEEEKLLKASQCYLSTTSGPIAGLLFISTHKIGFCSERSIKVVSPSGKFLRIHYKVSVPLRKIEAVNSSEDVYRPSKKYIQVVTEDKFEFWFMGFLNHTKTFKYLNEAINYSVLNRHL